MKQQPKWNRSAWTGLIAVLLVVGLLLTFFLLQQSRPQEEKIVLPTGPYQPAGQPGPEKAPETSFLEVTPSNVLSVLQIMGRPASYHQIYTITTGGDDAQSGCTVELWCNNELLHAELFDGRRTKTILTDGQSAYLWYHGDENVAAIKLDYSATTDELLGLPTYENLSLLEPEEIIDASFSVLEDPQVQCIYVVNQELPQGTEDVQPVVKRYWIDVETGLLFKADVLENSRQVYSIVQERYELLAEEDETFQDRFLLPDGTNPFTAAAEMPQP